MPAPLLHAGVEVHCIHGGSASPTMTNPGVLLGGHRTIFQTTPYVVANCGQQSTGTPCVTGQWLVPTARVSSYGQPLVLLLGSTCSTCTPTATPLLPVVSEPRVFAT